MQHKLCRAFTLDDLASRPVACFSFGDMIVSSNIFDVWLQLFFLEDFVFILLIIL